MSDGKKTYELKINGIAESVKDVTTLDDALQHLSKTAADGAKVTTTVTQATRTRTAALTEEERAERKLSDTIGKVAQVKSEANRAQIEANEALREATREAVLRAKAEQAEAGSIDEMRARLSLLNIEWKKLRVGSDEFEVMSEKILELNENIKRAEESTGDFRRSVGNYGRATEGLEKLSGGIEGVSKSSIGLAQSLLAANSLMGIFGQQSEEDAERAKNLQKIIALLSLAQQVNNNVVKQGIAFTKSATVADTIRTVQTKAKTAAEAASTKGTIAATIAQKAFNLVASANPYVILALALIGVGAALIAYTSNTDKAAASTERYTSDLDGMTFATKEARDAHDELARKIRDIQIEIDTANGLLSQYEASLKRLSNETADEMSNVEKEHAEALENIEKKYSGLGKRILAELKNIGSPFAAQAQLAAQAAAEIAAVEQKKQEKLTGIQAFEAKKRELIEANENKEKQRIYDEAERKRLEAQKQALINERDAMRVAEDARIKLIENSDEQAERAINVSYDRQIADLKKRLLDPQANLTIAARKAINDTIESLDQQRGKDLEKLQKEQAERALAITREVEDSLTGLIADGHTRQTAEINKQYDRQVESYKKRLDEDKTLTKEQQDQLTELIELAEKSRGDALAKLDAERLQRRADLELAAVEDALTAVENRIQEAVARDKTGLKLIDVDQTKKNFAELDNAMKDYEAGLRNYLANLKAAHEASIATLGGDERVAAEQEYARTVEDVTKRIGDSEKQRAANTKAAARVQIDALAELFGKISEYATAAADAIGMAMDTFNMGLQVEIDAINEQLDALSEKYDKAKQQHEDAAKDVEAIEQRMQTATGGTAIALQEQLQQAMQARNEALREEQRIAKEKERLEAEAAKKEKQVKRNQLISNIAVGVANVAQSVTAMLTAGPIVGQILAGIAAALGAVQIGIMTQQLAKLEDGGEVVGPSHASGGVPVLINGRPVVEAEGGEFVVNKHSYAANKGLVNFINSTTGTISLAELAGLFPESTGAPVSVSEAEQSGESRIIDAINGINFQPVVAVTDIRDVDETLVIVEDLVSV